MASPRTAPFNGLPEPVSPVNIKRRSRTSWLDDDDGDMPPSLHLSMPERTATQNHPRDRKKLTGEKRSLLDIVGPFQGPLCSLEDESENPVPSSPTSPEIVERSKSSQGNYASDFTSFPVSRWLGETHHKKLRTDKKDLLSPEFEVLAGRFRGLGTEEAETYRRKREGRVTVYPGTGADSVRVVAQEQRRTRDKSLIDEASVSRVGTVRNKEAIIASEEPQELEGENVQSLSVKKAEKLSAHMIESLSTMPDDYDEPEHSDSTLSFSSDSESEPSDNDEKDDSNSLHSECSYIVIDYADTTGTSSRSHVQSSGNAEERGKQPARNSAVPRRRSSTENNDSDGEDFSDNSERRRKRPRKNESNMTQESGDARKFACPYYRFNPNDPVHVKCKSRAFPTLARVKGHVLRTHLKPLQCERCCVYRAGDMGQISKHLQKNNCVKNKFIPMDREIERKGKALSRSGRIKTWAEVCVLIFECELDQIPPAYVDTDSTAASPKSPEGRQPSAPTTEEPLDALVNDTKFHSFVQDQLSRALSNMLPALLSQQLPALIAEYCNSQKSMTSGTVSASASFIESSTGNSFPGPSSSRSGSLPDSIDHGAYELVENTKNYPKHSRSELPAVQPLPSTVYTGPSQDNTHMPQQNTEHMPTATSSSSINYWNNTEVPNLDGMFDMNMDMDLGLFEGWETHENEESMLQGVYRS